MENAAAREDLTAEHGLSLYIEANGRRILFDAGQSAAFAQNAEALGVDLAGVDVCILSHGHYDHSGGLARFLEINDRAKVYMHRLAPQAHHNASQAYIGIDASLVQSGRIVFTDDRCDLGDGLTLCTCNEHISGVPASARGMTVKTASGLVQDDFRHEQYLILSQADKKAVISGCSHKGILNIVSWLSPDVLVGGFHLMKLDPAGEDAPLLEDIAEDLLSRDCTYYTGHCTGDAAFAFLKARMGDRLHGVHAGTEIAL